MFFFEEVQYDDIGVIVGAAIIGLQGTSICTYRKYSIRKVKRYVVLNYLTRQPEKGAGGGVEHLTTTRFPSWFVELYVR